MDHVWVIGLLQPRRNSLLVHHAHSCSVDYDLFLKNKLSFSIFTSFFFFFFFFLVVVVVVVLLELTVSAG